MLNAFLIYIIDLFKKKSRNFLTVSKALSNYCCVTPPPPKLCHETPSRRALFGIYILAPVVVEF